MKLLFLTMCRLSPLGKCLPSTSPEGTYLLRTYTRVVGKYSRVPNKRTGRLLENEKKSHLYALIQTYTFINFQQKVPPIRLFPLTLLLIFVLSMAHFDLRRPQKPLWGHNQKLINYKRIFYWNTKQPLLYPIECFQKSHLYVY